MPRSSPHSFIWSEAQQHYELITNGQTEYCFRQGDEPTWRNWLDAHTAFAFVGKSGRISVLKEARLRGAGYWYAYRTQARHTRKHYLGPTIKMTFDRLEEAVMTLRSKSLSASFAHVLTPQEKEVPFPHQATFGPEKSRPRILPQAELTGVLYPLKLSCPRLSIPLVERMRLLKELDAVYSHPLTLISAPAGSGKTMLLSSWVTLSNRGRPPQGDLEMTRETELNGARRSFAWLSLDERDNDPLSFGNAVIAALRTCSPTLGRRAFAMLHASEPPALSTILLAIFQEVVEDGSEIILILDDYHVISDQAILSAMPFFIDHLPGNLHLVLVTRTNPELPLSRFRLRGQMLEIRDLDLRFTQEEAASFLTKAMGLPLSEGDVAILHQRTEGWIAGLQLAALSLRKREDLSAFIKDFGGSHRYLLDYVQQEILVQLPGTLQDFLLQISILPRMNAALCQAVTASLTLQESQDMLEALERANLFVVPLDDERQWYRFHDLFREALCARLYATQPQLAPLLYQRAACFYEMVGEQREAIVCALSVPDYAYAAVLIEQVAESFWLNGETRIVQSWVLSLPDVILRTHLRLALEASLRFLDSVTIGIKTVHTSIQTLVGQTITRLEGILRRKSEMALSEAEEAWIERRLYLLRALIEGRSILRRGDIEQMRLLIHEMEDLPTDSEEIWNMIPLSFVFWLKASLQGEGALLIPQLRQAQERMLETRDHLATIRVMTWLAFAYLQAAQLHLAHRQCLDALTLIELTGSRTAAAGYLQYYLFTIYYSWNRLEEASHALQCLRRIAQDWYQVELLSLGEKALMQLSLAQGDLATAHQALQRAEKLVKQEEFADHARWVVAIRIEYWLAEGKLTAASHWVTQTAFSSERWNPLCKGEALMLVRVLLAQQQYTRAVETLEHLRQHLDHPGDLATTLHFLALYMVALYQSGKREQTTLVALRLLQLSEPENIIRVYLDTGPLMQQVLFLTLQAVSQEGQSSAPAILLFKPFISRLLAIFEQAERGSWQGEDLSPAPLYKAPLHSEDHTGKSAALKLLSAQEQRVLHLLVAGQTNAEIAEALIVSPNTIKTQISSIYRKLNVRRRAEAIAAATRQHLL